MDIAFGMKALQDSNRLDGYARYILWSEMDRRAIFAPNIPQRTAQQVHNHDIKISGLSLEMDLGHAIDFAQGAATMKKKKKGRKGPHIYHYGALMETWEQRRAPE